MSVLAKFGVQDVPDTFKNFILGRTVIIDGDDACYSCSAGAAKLSTAQKRFKTAIYEIMFLTKAQFARVHLTPKGCYKNGRHLLRGVKPYQGNRKGKPKPALLEMLRDTAVDVFKDDTDVDVFPQMYYEADDACVMDAYTVQNCIMWSKDKDLNLAPCTRYHIETGKELTITNLRLHFWVKRIQREQHGMENCLHRRQKICLLCFPLWVSLLRILQRYLHHPIPLKAAV